jgi:hypothetical protein
MRKHCPRYGRSLGNLLVLAGLIAIGIGGLAVGKKRDISESLNRLSQRLDDIDKMSSNQLSDISQACDEIGKELNKIEEELNSLH